MTEPFDKPLPVNARDIDAYIAEGLLPSRLRETILAKSYPDRRKFIEGYWLRGVRGRALDMAVGAARPVSAGPN